MPLLQPTEYNEAYFNGGHPAGYSKYSKYFRNDGINTQGEYWKDAAYGFLTSRAAQNKSVLDIGCAFGFIVESLREFGVDAYGVDISDYARSQSSIPEFITTSDALAHLLSLKRNSFDYIIGLDVLACFSNEYASLLFSECKRVGRSTLFFERGDNNPSFYNVNTVEEWNALAPAGVNIYDKAILWQPQ